ncbi:hypothetical protein EBU99_00770 [bacterium]|nr:hypothetical protein [bacterium]
MPVTAPKNSRNKRLHLVFFTDASKTKSTSISLRNLGIVICLVVLFFVAATGSLFFYRDNKNLLIQKDEYIRELKSAIASVAVTNEKSQTTMANEADPQTELARRVSKEIQFPSPQDKKSNPQVADNTLANLQSSLSSLSTVSANLARSDKADSKPTTPINFAKRDSEGKTQNNPPSADKSVSARDLASVPEPTTSGTKQTIPLSGVHLQQGHATEVNGQTTLHFQLINTSRTRGQSWTGRVCGIAEVGATGNSPNPAPSKLVSGFIAIPSGNRVESAQNPTNGCADGELVRFSRLRPTELVVPAKQDAIKRVTIFFVESNSNRTLTQEIEL